MLGRRAERAPFHISRSIAHRMSQIPLLSIANLSVGFEDTSVLKGLTFDVLERELFAVVGPAGVGKSTLLRTLARLNDPLPSYWAHGKISLGARDLLTLPLAEARREVAMLTQKAQLYTATVAENAIALARDNRQLTYREKRELARAVLDRCGLDHRLGQRLDEPVISLSLAEQRMLTVARLLGGGACCVLADEPFRDVSEPERDDLLSFFESLKDKCATIVVTHHQGEMRRLADRICLLSAGRVVEVAEANQFFSSPKSELTRMYLDTGNCWPRTSASEGELNELPPSEVTAPDTNASDLDQRHPSWHPSPEECRPRPRGFHWILPARLGGTQWPGLLQPEENDLRALTDLGVRHLVSLTEKPFPPERLAAHGISGHHEPIVDMMPPSIDAALRLCALVSRCVRDGEPIVVHCKAGLGRTGTILACCLVYEGQDALAAIHELRQVNRYYIQTREQFDFVPAFAAFLAANRSSSAV
jgi:atypical dual specificity phosphatase